MNIQKVLLWIAPILGGAMLLGLVAVVVVAALAVMAVF